VLEKCGFKLEGVSRKAVFKNNKLIDEYRYARVK
jgi:RimJ/RimL family protein N-acetyltransferase